MMGFDSKNKKIENLLRASRQDFRFDQGNTKARVMMAVNVRHLTKDDARRLTFNPRTWPKYVLGTSLATMALVASSTFAFAANLSKPGEVLFPVQKLQNRIVLSLPLAQTTKAQISTNIVAKRLKELDELQKDPKNLAKVNAEIKEVQASISIAASLVPETTDDLNPDDKARKKETDLDKILQRLNDLSTKHQQSLETLSTQVEDRDLKAEIEKSVSDISATNAKLQSSRKHKAIQGSTTTKDAASPIHNTDNQNNDSVDRHDHGDDNGLELKLNN